MCGGAGGADRLHADVEGGADRLPDREGEVEGAGEGVGRVVAHARRQPDGDDVRHAGVDKSLGGGLGEARGDKDETQRRDAARLVAARLQELLQRGRAYLREGESR